MSFLLFLSFGLDSFGHQLIIRFRGYNDHSRFLVDRRKLPEPKDLARVKRERDIMKYYPIVPELGIYLLVLPSTYSRAATSQIVRGIHNKYRLRYAVFNARVKLRKNYYVDSQWALNGNGAGTTNAAQAWKTYGAGATDRSFKNPVAAIVDDGVDVSHPNLRANVWVNPGEIPGDGKDNDNNGYVDDINGWDITKGNGKIAKGGHGTHVAGIVSAHATNRHTLYGISPTTKIMAVNATGFDPFSSGGMDVTSNVLKAYGYVLKQKQLWKSSQGRLGANVVSVNSSFGIDGANCEDPAYSSWNDMFNELGKAGILSVVATTNTSLNVDREGDVPSACKSPYVIAVSNVDIQGNPDGGYGKNSIDLHAPGTQIVSTYPNNKIVALSGTSMATPHVTGALAYLYKIGGNLTLQASLTNDPGKLALFMKKVLLNSVRPVNKLNNLSQTAGVLDLSRAAQLFSTSLNRSRLAQRNR